MENDKRKASRIKKPLVVQYSRDGKTWDISHVRDFSETGMQITTTEILKAGIILKFRVIIPLEPFDWLEFSGKVIVSSDLEAPSGTLMPDSHLTRIEFIRITDIQKNLMQKYIEWFSKRKNSET
ncbi:MAG: PilZ domain-containing protein [Candidatus Omnitrophota bacterium]